MGEKLKYFFSFNNHKTILLIALSVFAPLPFCVVYVIGFAPPVLILRWLPEFIFGAGADFFANPWVVILLLLFFLLHLLFAYLVSCVLYWIAINISPDAKKRLIIIGFFILCLVCLSLTNIFFLGDVGGGSHNFNIINLLLGNEH